MSMANIRFDRFSPYLTHPEAYGITNLKPYPSYALIYRGIRSEIIDDIAYYFVGDYGIKSQIDSYTEALGKAIDEWKSQHCDCAMFSIDLDSATLICDFRNPKNELFVVLNGVYKTIYFACNQIVAELTLFGLFQSFKGSDSYLEGDFQTVIEELLKRNLIIREGNTLLNLAVPLGCEYSPNHIVLQRFQKALDQISPSGISNEESLDLNDIADVLGPKPGMVTNKDSIFHNEGR